MADEHTYPQTADEALAVFVEQLSERIGRDRALSLKPFVSYNETDENQYPARPRRCIVGVWTIPGGWGHSITETGPRPDCVLTNAPLPVDAIVKLLGE